MNKKSIKDYWKQRHHP